MKNDYKNEQKADIYLSAAMKCAESRKLILPQLINILKDDWDQKLVSTKFFSDKSTIEMRSVNGIIETPQPLAAYMVKLAHSRWKSTNNNKGENCSIHWFDPCSGAGVFAIEILKYYSTIETSRDPKYYPRITISEISELGLTLSFVNIINTLESLGISSDLYIRMGKLQLILGDTLDQFNDKEDYFIEKGKFDIVIGNPPYVRATKLSYKYKEKLKQNFQKIYMGSADLYTYFIASGISNLHDTGILLYISPATYIRSKNGEMIRDWLLKNATLDTFIDLDETKVFADADLYAAIYVYLKIVRPPNKILYQHIQNGKRLSALINDEISLNEISSDLKIGTGWAFHESQESIDEQSKLFENCVKLESFGIKVYSGIRPGYSKAFIINEEKYNGLSIDTRKKWLKPIILASDIIKWSGQKELNYMVIIPAESTSVDSEILSFLSPHKSTLINRAEVKDKDKWYALRQCSYYNKMAKRKIVFPDISANQRFSIADEGIYIPDGAYFIDSDNLILLGILNSEIAKKFFIDRCSSIGNLNSKGRFRFKKGIIKNFPLPKNFLSDGIIQKKISALVSLIIKNGESISSNKKLNSLVEDLYRTKNDQ